MTEQEFLNKRIPIWLEGDDLHVSRPTGSDANDFHTYLSKKYNFEWIYTVRGYYWPKSHVQLYVSDYETPNCTIMIVPYIFNYFPDIKYIGLGCNKGKIGEIWEPKICVYRNLIK